MSKSPEYKFAKTVPAPGFYMNLKQQVTPHMAVYEDIYGDLWTASRRGDRIKYVKTSAK